MFMAQRNDKRQGRGNVDKAFWNRLSKLIRIVLPGWKSREARNIYLLTALLVVRTLMSIWLADVNGRVVKAIVNKSLSEFMVRVSATAITERVFTPALRRVRSSTCSCSRFHLR